MSKKYPLVYIIILNWNGLKDTLECLGSVFGMDYPAFKILVLDNFSSDNSIQVIRELYPQVEVVESRENLGYTGGNNVAMKIAMDRGADYLWLLNNDTEVEGYALDALVAAAEGDAKVGLVSPIIAYYSDKGRVQFCGSYLEWSKYRIVYPAKKDEYLEISQKYTVGSNVLLWGTALLVKRNVVEDVGYLDDRFFAYYEDTDYSIRALKAGYRNMICTTSKIYHKAPLYEAHKPHYYYYMSRNLYLFIDKHFKDMGKVAKFRSYFSQLLFMAPEADICMEGAWAAMHGDTGPWKTDVRMPKRLKACLMTVFSFHPYFLSYCLNGEYSKIASESLERIRRKFRRVFRRHKP